MAKPLFSYTTNFFLKIDLSRPAFKAQALYSADAVEADAALPAEVRAKAVPVRTGAVAFNEKLVASVKANAAENFGDVRVESDKLLRTLMRRFVGARYEKDTDDYDRFLPDGLGEYNDADEKRYEVLFERFVQAMNAETVPFKDHDNPAAPAPAAQADQMLARLANATKTDTQYESGQDRTTRDLTADWRVVAIAQWRLWLTLCDHFADDPDYQARVYGYFDFSEVHMRGEESEDVAAPTPQP